ncbi:translation initiation factor SUI1, putative [Plasmodium berghei]|uniref:Translation initiation factor SUI1, putative n=2 Tax=Plasmodium berghei TaxID=5821 RepID=A0A509AJ69_PLABA|nr:translation initiation factor SUI1, putative [Plasmodium berghei ANKA]CXI30620.1 translation initiation factor SUI1, putative [Plasmodium berghei]SCM20885.1 translation initiation factor SUI1, putative [Plasmodium berghei]SCN24368.1 translation initiation factor SUI1, putative [Plasmodium berghei]SCO59541.1 translation initiation factor SUI1, putative [Plasmodium berghei]SCO60759.1 translation initiation factor SUI1, putative [Plasmodium berghei]|eukprot:XP_034421061.1 translation initiation factor SUI1, putative [Plasmodium berghei ANKA]
MFKNKVTLSNKNFLGNKDRKKLAIILKSTFNIENDEEINELLDKEDASICKVQKKKITIYFSKNNPVLVSINNLIFPTVYTLWKFPRMIPCFVIYPPASEFLLRGADLMIPGICKNIDDLDKLKPGAIWGVRVFNNPYIFAVGECCVEYNNNNMKDLYTSKGKCLKLVHTFTDELWKLGSLDIPDISFKNKIIDSVENIVDDFSEFKIYGENNKGAKKKNNNKNNNKINNDIKIEEKKKEKKDEKGKFGWSSDSDTSEVKKSDSEKVAEKENEKTYKGSSNEKYLANFYKHFDIILKNKNKEKNSPNELKLKNSNTGITVIASNNNCNKKEHIHDLNSMDNGINLSKENYMNKEDNWENIEESIASVDNNYNNSILSETEREGHIFSGDENSVNEEKDIISEQGDNHKNLKNKKQRNQKNKHVGKKKDKHEHNEVQYSSNDENGGENKTNEYDSHNNKNYNNIFELQTEQQDKLLLYLFLESIYYITDESLPIDASGIYSKMTKECSYIHKNKIFLEDLENDNVSYELIKKINKKEINILLDIKKSSYKKLIKFIQHCSKIKLINIKENRNIVSIVNINKEHPLFSSYKFMDINEKKKCDNENSKNENTASNSKGAQVLEFYMPSTKTLNIFKHINKKTDKNTYFTIKELREIFHTYITLNNLQSDKDKSLIKINNDIQTFLLSEKCDNMLPYDIAVNKFISLQQPCYAIVKPNANFDIDPIKIIKGVCPSIHIYSVARMKGKKYVTHITNLYLFYVDLQKFSEQIQKQLACSCSIVISPSTQKEEVLVQGNVVNQIHTILITNYFLPRKYIVLNVK